MFNNFPFTPIRIFLNPQLFLSGYGFRPHASNSESGYFEISRVEKNKSATNPITCGRVNPDIFESRWRSKFVSSLLPNNKPIWRHNSNTEGKFAATIARFLAHALNTFYCRGAWVLQWIWISSDACGQAHSIWIRYVWMGKFLNPERKIRGFKNIRIRVDGASVTIEKS